MTSWRIQSISSFLKCSFWSYIDSIYFKIFPMVPRLCNLESKREKYFRCDEGIVRHDEAVEP